MNWQRVTIIGLVLAAIVALSVLAPQERVTDIITMILAFVGGWAMPSGRAQQSPVKSLKPKPKGWLPILLMLPLLGGCAAQKTTLDPQLLWTRTDPGSAALMSPDGDMSARYQGVAPTHLNQGETGTWMTTPGEGGVITYSATTNTVYIWSPKDSRLENVSFTPQPEPGEPTFTADSIDLNMSDVSRVRADQFESAMQAIQGMTRDQARAWVEQTETISDAAKDVLLRAIPYLIP